MTHLAYFPIYTHFENEVFTVWLIVASVEEMEEQDKTCGIILSNLFMRQSFTIYLEADSSETPRLKKGEKSHPNQAYNIRIHNGNRGHTYMRKRRR